MGRHAEIGGAGFAGLVAAAALARGGWSVRLHEAAAAMRSVGSGIYVFPFAQAALESIGALERVRRDAYVPTRRTITINGDAQSITELTDLLTTTRARLHDALVATAREAGVEIAMGSQAVGADPAGALLLAGGGRTEADLVVAADGARSAIAAASGFRVDRVRHTDGITRVLLDRSGMRTPDWDEIVDMYDYRHRPLRALYTPCGADAFYLCLMTPAEDETGARVPIDAALWTRSFPALAPAFARIGDRGRHDRYGTIRVDRWSSGRSAVVGDAAHAMPSSLGQGAGVSMFNALKMAETVVADGVEAGLARWESEMRPIVERWQRQAEQVAFERSLATARHPGHDLAAEARTPLEAV